MWTGIAIELRATPRTTVNFLSTWNGLFLSIKFPKAKSIYRFRVKAAPQSHTDSDQNRLFLFLLILLQLVGELSAEFFQFGADDVLAVLLVRIELEIVLVIVFGGIKFIEGRDLCDDRVFELA